MAKLLMLNDQMHTIAFNIVKDAGKAVSVQEVATHPLATKIRCQTHHAATALNGLVKVGKLCRYKAGRMWVYELPPVKGEPVIKPVNIPPEVPVAAIPGLQIQINKTTKRLSLMYQGLQIEISVVE
jgi:hypothetical protein